MKDEAENHADNDLPPYGGASGSDAPFVEGSNHGENHFGPRKFGSAARGARDDAPAPTMLAGGLVPGNDAPFVRKRRAAPRPGVRGGQGQRLLDGDSPSATTPGANAGPDFIRPPTGPVAPSEYATRLSTLLPKEAPPTRPGMRLASFFCGGGGIDLGFRSAGIELAFASDYWIGAVKAFTHNLGHAPLHSDIREVDETKLPKDIDIVTGGFPCVTFSTAGGRAGVDDDLNGKLYLELCRVISQIKPRYFVAENVKGIISANGGNAIKLVTAAFLRLGYRTEWQLVNMAEHGVAQTRHRVFFVGVRLDQWRGSFSFPKKTHRLRGDKKAEPWLPIAVSLKQAIDDLGVPIAATMYGDAHLKTVLKKNGKGHEQDGFIKYNSPTVPSSAEEPAKANVAYGPHVVFAARNPDFANPLRAGKEPGVAITASRPPDLHIGGAEASEDAGYDAAFVDGVRRMTVRECARVQSFPDWYFFPGAAADGYRVIGNSVCPLYALRLGEALIEYDGRKIL